MKLSLLSRIAGIALLTAGLAGCVDMTMDINVTSDTTAKATTTMVMAASVYPMIKSAGAQGGSTEKPFCKENGDTLTENADGSATCVSVSEGNFADLKLDDGQSKPTFTVVSPGVVRIAVSTKDFSKDVAGGGEQDEQTQAMMKQYFEGHFLTLRFGGKEVTDTNMTLSADKTSAETVIPFIDMMNGTAKLPDELYAVVKTN